MGEDRSDLVDEVPVALEALRFTCQPALDGFLERVRRRSASSTIRDSVFDVPLKVGSVRATPKRSANPLPGMLNPDFPTPSVLADRHFCKYPSKSPRAILTHPLILVGTSFPSAMSRLMVEVDTIASCATSSIV